MAGTDQSVNLGGMLSGIAETTGTMGDAFKPVLQAATKPRGDMNDPNHLRNLAQWASNNGDAQQAAMYLSTAERIDRERQAENRRVQQEAKQVAKVTATQAYAEAVKSGDAGAIDAAYKEALRVGKDTGQEMLQGLRGIDSAQAAQERDALAKTQAERAANEDKAVQTAMEGFKGATPEEIQSIVEDTPAEFRAAVQTAAAQHISMGNVIAAQRDRMQDMSAPVEWSEVETAIGSIQSPGQRKKYEAQLKRVREQSNKAFVNGTWVHPRAKEEAFKREERLYQEVTAVTVAEAVAAERALRDTDEQMSDDLRRAAIKPIDDTDVEAYIEKKDTWRWGDEPTWEEAKEALRQERLQPIYDFYGKPAPWAEPKEAEGGSTGDQPLPAGVVVEVVEE